MFPLLMEKSKVQRGSDGDEILHKAYKRIMRNVLNGLMMVHYASVISKHTILLANPYSLSLGVLGFLEQEVQVRLKNSEMFSGGTIQ